MAQGQGGFTWDMDPGPEFKRVMAALRRMDSSLPGELRKKLRKAGNRGVKAAKAGALGMIQSSSSHRYGHHGTRRQVARGVRLLVSSGSARYPVRMRIITVMPPGMEMLPRGFESEWHHPVFGDHTEEVIQHSNVDWFMGPIQSEMPLVRSEIQLLLREAADKVREAGSHGPT